MTNSLRLYFFRHAEAEPGSNSLPDHERSLTKRGSERTARAASVLKALGVQPARLYSSPLVRARQTAEILGDKLNVPVQIRAELGPGFNAQAAEALIRDLQPDSEVIFVGHEPDFSATVSTLISGGQVTMKKGGLARVDIEQRQPLRGSLIWLIAPKVFDGG